jgi:hypothetical protein
MLKRSNSQRWKRQSKLEEKIRKMHDWGGGGDRKQEKNSHFAN